MKRELDQSVSEKGIMTGLGLHKNADGHWISKLTEHFLQLKNFVKMKSLSVSWN
jgi:hypothetical protein